MHTHAVGELYMQTHVYQFSSQNNGLDEKLPLGCTL